MKVRDPHGQTWRVTRRWVPWRRKLKGALDSVPDVGATGLGDDPISMIVGLVLLVLLLPFLVLAFVAAIELLLVLLLLPVAVLGRVLLGRHWTVEVRRSFTPFHEEPAGSWSDAGQRIAAISAMIAEGRLPPHTLGSPRDRTPHQGRPSEVHRP